MPFKSTAQQRYMYAQHPEIAQRWTNEMRNSRRKGAKQHPIKSANLPRHVGKSVGSRLRGLGDSYRSQHQLANELGSNWKATKATISSDVQAQRARSNNANPETQAIRARMAEQGIDWRRNVPAARSTGVGKRANGGSFDSGPSAVVRGMSRGTARRGRTTSRFGGTPSHGSRKAEPGLEVYHPSRVTKAGSGPLFTPTNALPRPKAPQIPPPTTGVPPSAGNTAGDGRPGTLVPTGGNASAPGASPASSASTPSSAPTTGTIGAAANMTAQPKRAVGQRGPAKLSKADGTMLVRLHGNYPRNYDPESNRQRRLGQAQATTALGGAAGVGAGAKHLRDLNRHTKVVPRKEAATALHRTIAVNRRGAAMVGAGLAGLAASNRLRRYAGDPRNREWD